MSETTTPRLKVSREGIVLIKSFEGFRPRAVPDQAGRWVIGYGHRASAREGLTIGERDAELLLQYDLLPVVRVLNLDVSVPLNQHQFDALASFAVSVGVDRFMASDVLREINAGHAGEAADALIGWPESASPDAALRRRAAERALFVADPSHAVALSELLSAPLPPPPIEIAVPEAAPAPDAVSIPAAHARAVAVASLLGEAPPAAPPEPEPRPEAAASPTVAPLPPHVTVHLQRYSPYAATLIGPLPGFPAAAAADPEPAALDLAPVAPAASIEPEPPVAPLEAEAAAPTTAAEPVAPPPAIPLETTPFAAPPAASPFPPMDGPLVLTPATESDFIETARPTWSAEQRAPSPAADEIVLFDDEPPLSVMRHEVEPPTPRRFDWSGTGAYVFMGGLGLASCAFSAAGFRLSVVEPSPMGETTVVAWALALIGVICVGVSSWNLYVRWGKGD